MKKMSSQEIRNTWLNFFKERGHMVEPGASLVPHNDPSLLWINAGVSALKKYFDGSEIPESRRIVNIQKSIRTNDIENVGKTARHHTFFEMVGNFSIGDYFREEIIPWAFTILTDEKYFGLDKDKLYITYYPDDLDTKKLWLKQGVEESHLIPNEGNFWEIGEGPSGPDTEIFFDRGEKYDKENIGLDLLINDIDNERYVEIWNIVFSQFNAQAGVERKNYKELPHKNIDTGGGLERFACIIQETETNFETDLFMPIIKQIEEITGKGYSGENLMAFRVIADHARSCVFALADGATFSNEGRGYVLRRLLRRAMKYGKKLGTHEPFLYKLVPSVIDAMKEFYPYIIEKNEYIQNIIKSEEVKFLKTLNSGELILESMIKGKSSLSGEDAFKLYDTFGFPIELTSEICEESNVSVDLDGFKVCLNKQRELARNNRKNIDTFSKQSKDLLDFDTRSTFDYGASDRKSKIIGLFKDGERVAQLEDEGDVMFDITPFYAEMGGQIADTGTIKTGDSLANVTYVGIAPNKQHLHHIEVLYGVLKENDVVDLSIDHKKHDAIVKNHSATHLLQKALINVLGNTVEQKGSFVSDEYLRFDFSYFEKISYKDLNKVERLVNEYINDALENDTQDLPIEEALKTGALCLFDEKYGKSVRVVSFGDVSKEFCGGSHVKNTSDIGIFTIVSEESIASGIRRIEAKTSLNAYNYLHKKIDVLNEARNLLDAKTIQDVTLKINSQIEKTKILEGVIKQQMSDIAKIKADILKQKAVTKGDHKTIIEYVSGASKDLLIYIIDEIKLLNSNFIVVLVGEEDNKKPCVISVGKDLTAKGIKAGDLMKKVTSILGGNGGGKPDLAQGNVTNVDLIDKVRKELL
ncbi:MAG TPA: alanine--tRNA ligase [Candidatus Onthovivens sp.]|nr:alanine--tRNA ligase [Candidatus Onthovivens sp.]